MGKHKKITRLQPWQVRKIMYALAALVGAVAVAAGWVDQSTVDSVLPHLDNVLAVVSTLLLGLASANTHSGSDIRSGGE